MDYKEYNNQIDSKIDWVGDIPQHWKKSKFKHEFSFSKSVNASKNPTILSLTLQGIKIRDISTNEGQIASSYDNYTKVYKRDIVLNPMDLISGFVDCSPVEGVISPAYYTLKPNKDIDPEYYKYYLQKHYYERIFFPFAEGVSVDHRWTLKKEDFLNFSLIKPPLGEQKQISKYLDKQTSKIDATIAKNKELIELLEEKKIALINHIVTKGLNPNIQMKNSGVKWIDKIPEHYQMMKISNMFNNIGSGTTPKSSNEEYYLDGDINWLITGDLNDEYIYETSIQITTKALHDISSLKIYPQDSLVIAMYGGTIGKLGILKVETCTNQACCVLSGSNNLNIKYVYYWFLGYRNEIISLSYGGGQPNISQDVIKNLKIIVPPLNEQTNIVDYLDNEITNINASISKINESIDLLEEYKISLIHHAVTGKIDVREEVI